MIAIGSFPNEKLDLLEKDTLDVRIDILSESSHFEIAKFARAYDMGLRKGTIEVGKRAVERMKIELGRVGLSGSELNNISLKIRPYGFDILVLSNHALYVEFGTGIVGSNKPHPHPELVGWQYDINKHGKKGWIYYDARGKKRWTSGSPAKPFMYRTYVWIKRYANRIIVKNINAELRKVGGGKFR